MTPKIESRLSALTQTLGRAGRSVMLAAVLSFTATSLTIAVTPVQAQGTKIGFVNTEHILRDSKPAQAVQSKIDSEFKRRDDELQKMANNLRNQVEKFDKDAPVLSDSERITRGRQLEDLDSDLQRKQREFQEDFNRRRNEEYSKIIEQVEKAIQKIAESEGYDLIIQDAITVSPRVDITDQVLKALGG